MSSPKLLVRVRTVIRLKHYSPKTEKAYVAWIRRLVHFCDMRHPERCGVAVTWYGRASRGSEPPSFRSMWSRGDRDDAGDIEERALFSRTHRNRCSCSVGRRRRFFGQ